MTVLLIVRFRKLPVAAGAIRVRYAFVEVQNTETHRADAALPLLITYLVNALR